MSHTIYPVKKSEEDCVGTWRDWVLVLSTGVSMQELEEKLRRGILPKGIRECLKKAIACSLSLFQNSTTAGHTWLPKEIATKYKIEHMRSSSPIHAVDVWPTHIRWASLCEMARTLVTSGKIPSTTFTPPIVSEYRELHDKFRDFMYSYIRDYYIVKRPLLISREHEIEYYIRNYRIRGRIDIYILSAPKHDTIVNYVIEVTLRTPRTITIEWLTTYMLGVYYRTLQPTVGLVVTPTEIRLTALNPHMVRKLLKLLTPPSLDTALHRAQEAEKHRQWICSNCDLKGICPIR